jgi:putative FmdB family regulatory protein
VELLLDDFCFTLKALDEKYQDLGEPMPTYEYRCKKCGHEFEELQKITASPLTQCPVCHEKALTRVIGGGAGLIFKGEGFYITDYKKSGKDGEKKETKKKGKTPGKTTPPPSTTKSD